MPPAIDGLMRPPVPCLGRSNSELRFASQSHKSCTTTPPACSARRNTYQSRSASLDIRCLPCVLIWHSKALIARTGLVIVLVPTSGRETPRQAADRCGPRCQPGVATRWGMGQIESHLGIDMCRVAILQHIFVTVVRRMICRAARRDLQCMFGVDGR